MNAPANRLNGHLVRLSNKKRPVVRLIVLSTLLGCIALWIAAAVLVVSSRRSQIRQTEVATSNIARLVAAQVESAMKTAGLALVDVNERVRHDGTGPEALARLQEHLIDLAGSTPELHGLFVYGADGAWLATSLRRPVKGNNSDRAYFQYHLAHPGTAMHVGAPIKSRSTGVWIIPISRRLDRADGTFAGVVLVTMKINFFERIYEELDVGRTGTVLLALADGTIVYRRPFEERLIGTSLAHGAVFHEVRRHPVGSAFLVAKIDGIERLYSYRRLADFPFVVAVGQTKDELLGNWKRSSILIGIGTFLVSILFGVFARKLVGQIVVRDRLDHQLRAYSEDLQQHNMGLQVLAHTDRLTQLANRGRFDDVLDQELRRARRNRTPLSLILLDIDFFKTFNDHYGHVAGDACLQRVGRVLAEQIVRAGDLPARYGGEEFAVILPQTGREGALAVAERIRHAIAALEIPHDPAEAGIVTASLGVATVAAGADTDAGASDIIEAADASLYRAKHAGRNRVGATAQG